MEFIRVGGATPAHGMRSKRVGRAALGRLVLRPSVRPSVCAFVTRKRAQKGSKIIGIPLGL